MAEQKKKGVAARSLAIGAGRQESPADTPTELDLDRSIPVLVTILANRITTSGSFTFRRLHGLGSTEWKVLSTIAIESGVTGARISQLVGLDRAAVSRTLKIFRDRKLTQVDQHERHKNYQSVTLTPAGRALHDKALLTAFSREAVLLSDFTGQEREQLIHFLQRLLKNAGDLAKSA